jgi:hypothetical protein
MTQIDLMQALLAMNKVERAPSDSKYYFNCGSVESVLTLQQSLRNSGVDDTVVCSAPPHDPDNVYYTPKYATMGAGATWAPSAVNA